MSASKHHRYDVADIEMRLANLRTASGYALGMEMPQGMVNITASATALGLPAPRDIDDLLQNERAVEVRTVIDALADSPGSAHIVSAQDVRFAPLVTRPEKILCVGFNYREHAAETNTPIPQKPPLFAKFANALNHHEGVVALPVNADDRFDYETELVIVIGRACAKVSVDDALDYVAGYATGNDISARSLQTVTTQFTAGKASDGFAPIGPWLVPAGQIADPQELTLRTFVNGEKRQDWSTADMIFNCRQVISYAASFMTLKAGDVIFTGTPQGVIFGEKIPAEQRRWLRAGDEVVSSIERLGDLRVRLA